MIIIEEHLLYCKAMTHSNCIVFVMSNFELFSFVKFVLVYLWVILGDL